MTTIPPASRCVGAKLIGVVGHDLRTLYREVLHLPVPDHLAAVIERLEEYGRGGRSR
jgi:hypothetical protein